MHRGKGIAGNRSPSNENRNARAGSTYPYEFPCLPNNVEFEPFENCPKNYVIFDHTENKSRIMYNPALAQKYSIIRSTPPHGNRDDGHCDDADDIDALLSSDGEGEDEDGDAISTGRTPANWRGGSPDSTCSSSACPESSKLAASERKRQKTRKMVRTLRGIIPGGDRMDTPAVLDEAVRYLKSLKVEAKKLGIQHRNN